MSLLLFRVHVSSLLLDMAPSQGLLLPSPCKEVSLMIDHHGLKVLQVNLALCLTHIQVYHPHPKVFPVSLLLFSFLGSSLPLLTRAALAPRLGPLLPSPRREVPLMVDHLHLKMSQVRLPLDLNPPMQVCHCPHPKLVHLPLFRVLGSSLHLPSQGALAPSQDPLLSSPCREALLMVDHLNVKMLLVSLSVGGLPHMQVCHCPHHKLFYQYCSGFKEAVYIPLHRGLWHPVRILYLLPCREALLMVDHLKMSQVRFTLGLPHMQVCRCPHPKVLLVSPANHIKAILCLKARSLKNGSLQPLV